MKIRKSRTKKSFETLAEGLQGISRPWWQGLEEIFIFLKNTNKKLWYFLAFLADMADLIKIGPKH
jgi:hypothetical protein